MGQQQRQLCSARSLFAHKKVQLSRVMLTYPSNCCRRCRDRVELLSAPTVSATRSMRSYGDRIPAQSCDVCGEIPGGERLRISPTAFQTIHPYYNEVRPSPLQSIFIYFRN